MKVAIAAIHIAPESPDQPVVGIHVREPGIVRGAMIDVHESLISLGRQRDLEERLVLFVECDPDAPMRLRHFLVLNTNQAFTPPKNAAAEFVATARSTATPSVAHVFEIKPLQ